MDETEFRACLDPQALLDFVRKTTDSERKRRLLACALLRSRWDLLQERSRQALIVAENFADGIASDNERDAARWLQRRDFSRYADGNPRRMCWAVRHVLACHRAFRVGNVLNHLTDVNRDTRFICDLIRHAFGSPFRPVAVPGHLPTTVLDLAAAVYGGENCVFALHDALLEAGVGQLAEHFGDNRRHFKGCAALDAILRRQ